VAAALSTAAAECGGRGDDDGTVVSGDDGGGEPTALVVLDVDVGVVVAGAVVDSGSAAGGVVVVLGPPDGGAMGDGAGAMAVAGVAAAFGACCERATGRAPAGKSARNRMSTDTPVAVAIRRRRVAAGPPSNSSHSIADRPPLARNATSRRSAWWMIHVREPCEPPIVRDP
jgi:hypothetical protein